MLPQIWVSDMKSIHWNRNNGKVIKMIKEKDQKIEEKNNRDWNWGERF